MTRTYILRTCPDCLETKSVRKDGAGILCSKCRAKANNKIRKPKDISNRKFGKLTVVSLAYIEKSAFWNCICSCGNKCIIHGNRLRSGKTKSCGCIIKTMKGLSHSKTYKTWASMKQRCYDESVPHYERYGGKGIKVCDRWINSFDNFIADMGLRPKNKTLDRIDSNKDYFPENCRWATPKEQARFKKSGFFITAFGKTKRLIEWAEEVNIGWSTLRKRIVCLKWKPEEALSLKVYEGRKKQK